MFDNNGLDKFKIRKNRKIEPANLHMESWSVCFFLRTPEEAGMSWLSGQLAFNLDHSNKHTDLNSESGLELKIENKSYAMSFAPISF